MMRYLHFPFSSVLLLFLLFPLLLLFLVHPVLAQQGHLTLLTVAENEANASSPDQGGTADLFLDIRPGSGQIFIDSFPLTRLDTQASTRYANKVACGFADVDCSRHDFFYTIRAGSTVVGGPSAGAAIAVLTAAMLLDEELDESIVITGTINSGAIIGPVGGIVAKATAAKEAGMSKVVISTFAYPTEMNKSYMAEVNGSGKNVTINLTLLYPPANLSEIGIPVIKVTSLEEALTVFTGEELVVAPPLSLAENPAYTEVMRDVSESLCTRRDDLSAALVRDGSINESFFGENRSLYREGAAEDEDWYSLASYCFGELITLRAIAFEDLSDFAKKSQYASLVKRINTFESNLEKRNLSTLAELETSMIVSERLREAKDVLREQNLSNISSSGLAYAHERVNSANAWSAFFQMESPVIALDEAHLLDACQAKLIEAEERINYAELYVPAEFLKEAREERGLAAAAKNDARYPLCLFRASKAQALASLFTGSMSIPREKVDDLVQGKLDAAARVIQEQTEDDHFPIIGYSYYRYASSLASHDPYSALTFAEYSLELSGLNIFFPEERGFRLHPFFLPFFMVFFSGMLIGLFVGLFGRRRLNAGASKRKDSRRKPTKQRKK